MKKAKIKPLPAVKEFEKYFLSRARRVLNLKKDNYDSYHIEYSNTTRNIKVWFFNKDSRVIASATFTADGKRKPNGRPSAQRSDHERIQRI